MVNFRALFVLSTLNKPSKNGLLITKIMFECSIYIDVLVQDCSDSIANALELLQSCTKKLRLNSNTCSSHHVGMSENLFCNSCYLIFLQVKDIELCPTPFTLENGLLTPTFKSKRPALRLHFQAQMDDMYAKAKAQ